MLAVHADTPSGPPTVASVSAPEVTSRDIALLVLASEDGMPGLLSAQSAGPEARRRMPPSALRRLSEVEPLLRPVADILARAPRHLAVVVPTGLLGLVPLHAAVVAGQILDDLGEIHLAPSAAAHAACRKRAAQLRPQQLVGVANPDGTLPCSEAELAAIRDLSSPDHQPHARSAPMRPERGFLGTSRRHHIFIWPVTGPAPYQHGRWRAPAGRARRADHR